MSIGIPLNALPSALSISNTFTKVGAIAAFAALLGIAVLSLLVFSQAREIKRLREWAGRAPERAVEMEQRVSADAAARLQRGPTPPVATGARVVPRKTPLVSAPVSTAVNATASAAVPAAGTPSASAVAAAPQATAAPVAPDANTTPVASGAVEPETEGPETEASLQTPVGAAEPSAPTDAKPDPVEAVPVSSEAPAGVDAAAISPAASQESQAPDSEAPAPATAAAVARSPLPPSPSAPSPPADRLSTVPSTDAQAPQRPASARPPAPVAAARRPPSRTVAVAGVPPRAPAPRSAGVLRGQSPPSPRASGSTAPASGPRYFKQESSPARAVVLVVGGLIVVVLALVFAVSALKGGSGSPTASTPTQSSVSQSSGTHKSARVNVSNPTDTTVTVLNGTGTAGLAHHLASDLQQDGYSQAAASSAVPQGTHPTTVVEYAHGYRADAQAVARALNVAQVQPIDSSTAALAGSGTVVVLAGADQAALLGGGAAQSQGEPAAAP
ncbi:MAG: LytR C-terminal domain-containing protein [Solirubrobacteraceae bacterium]